jgi:hypothetical protein
LTAKAIAKRVMASQLHQTKETIKALYPNCNGFRRKDPDLAIMPPVNQLIDSDLGLQPPNAAMLSGVVLRIDISALPLQPARDDIHQRLI